jgi:MoxR-like ATPase
MSTKPKYDWTSVRGVLAKVVETSTKKRLEVLKGQGDLSNYMVAGERSSRDSFVHNNVVTIDIKVSKDVNYYMLDSDITLFCDSFEGADNQKKIDAYIKGHDYGPGVEKTATDSKSEPTPEPTVAVDPEKAKEYVIKAPKIPKDSIVMEDAKWRAICGGVQLDQYPILLGPKGCGKTMAAKAIANALGMEFHTFNLGQAFKPKKFFVGGMAANETGTYFVPSEFYNAFCSPKPTLILLDEITRTPAQGTNFLMTITDRKQSYIYNEDTGERVMRGKDVRFIAAGNMGMEYVDTRTMDGAFKDRFTPFHLSYLPEAKEVALLQSKFPAAPSVGITKLVKSANIIRKAEEAGSISQSMSTRKLEDLVAYLQGGFDYKIVEEMFLSIFVNGNIDERADVRGLLQSV